MRKLETRAPWNATGRKNLPPCWWHLTTMRRNWPGTYPGAFRENRAYGEGCSEKTVYYLDKGVIASLVVPNEFFMGYQCVKELAEKINYHQDNGVTEDTVDFLSVTREKSL